MLAFTNTLTGAKETLVPLHTHHVRMYHCGPTVYSFAHIGNFRSFLFADLLRRFLESEGYQVTQVMNITDVGHLTDDDFERGEDKLLAAARAEGATVFDVARKYEAAFIADAERLRMKTPHVRPRATAHVPEMLALIQALIDRGHAYCAQGECYYHVPSFPAYGRLSGNSIDGLVAGARVAPHPAKRHPADFALWKTDPHHLMQWDPHDPALWAGWKGPPPRLDPALARGFPGWHIECSAMSMKYLGESFDIHTGGEDNIFPHHECEIAQSEGLTDRPFVHLWMHARHLQVNGRKMSKRDGTFLRVRDVLDALGYDPRVLRYELISAQYRQPLNFRIGERAEALLRELHAGGGSGSLPDGDLADLLARRGVELRLENLDQARTALGRLQDFVRRLQECAGQRTGSVSDGPAPGQRAGSVSDGPAAIAPLIAEAGRDFRAALADDLNVAGALAAVFDFMNAVNKRPPVPAEAAAALAQMQRFDEVLGVLDFDAAPDAPDAEIEALIARRTAARSARDWAAADALRAELAHRGILLEDRPDGRVRWRRAP